MTTIQSVRDFLGLRRLAVVGVSRNPRDFTRSLFRELRQRGYDVVPVNPNLQEVDGLPCVSNVQEASPPVEGALLLTHPSATNLVVHDCAEAGIHHVWMYRAAGEGAVSAAASEFCRSNGIDLVEGECPFMFFQGTSFIHRAHGFCRKILGRFPN
ncbi:MAG TPA: CoA-binding protein [Bryobacteraceae bacterium]|nr:CoA-binding protein [Bryobacteraceae bacterium]